MKHKWIILIVLVLALSSCSTQELASETEPGHPDVRLELVSLRQAGSETILTIKWINNTDFEVLYGEPFGLEKLENGEWIPCSQKENTGFHTVGYVLKPKSFADKSYNTQWIYGSLKPGTYRFVSSCTWYETYVGEHLTLQAEFTLDDSIGESSPAPIRLLCDSGTYTLQPGSFSWHYLTGDGTWSCAKADALHPLQMKDQLELIQTGAADVTLEFEREPQKVSVHCWKDDRWGSTDGSFKTVQVENNSFRLESGGYIYEITVSWQNTNLPEYGTASYVFYAAPAMPLNIPQSWHKDELP